MLSKKNIQYIKETFFFSNRGQMSLSKLFSIILGVFVIVIIIVGTVQEWFNPLMESIVSKADSILVKIKTKQLDDTPEDSCAIPDYKNVNINGRNIKLEIRRCSNLCEVISRDGTYLSESINQNGILKLKYDRKNILLWYSNSKDGEYYQYFSKNFLEEVENNISLYNLNELNESIDWKKFILERLNNYYIDEQDYKIEEIQKEIFNIFRTSPLEVVILLENGYIEKDGPSRPQKGSVYLWNYDKYILKIINPGVQQVLTVVGNSLVSAAEVVLNTGGNVGNWFFNLFREDKKFEEINLDKIELNQIEYSSSDLGRLSPENYQTINVNTFFDSKHSSINYEDKEYSIEYLIEKINDDINEKSKYNRIWIGYNLFTPFSIKLNYNYRNESDKFLLSSYIKNFMKKNIIQKEYINKKLQEYIYSLNSETIVFPHQKIYYDSNSKDCIEEKDKIQVNKNVISIDQKYGLSYNDFPCFCKKDGINKDIGFLFVKFNDISMNWDFFDNSFIIPDDIEFENSLQELIEEVKGLCYFK